MRYPTLPRQLLTLAIAATLAGVAQAEDLPTTEANAAASASGNHDVVAWTRWW